MTEPRITFGGLLWFLLALMVLVWCVAWLFDADLQPFLITHSGGAL